jgi:hypothetical protein
MANGHAWYQSTDHFLAYPNMYSFGIVTMKNIFLGALEGKKNGHFWGYFSKNYFDLFLIEFFCGFDFFKKKKGLKLQI